MKKGKDFEMLVAFIEKGLNNNPNIEVIHNTHLKTKKGNRRQIDVLIKEKKGRFDFITVIECKDTKAKVNLNTLSAFKELLNQVSANMGIMVSKNGFQQGAITEAKNEIIHLYEFNQLKKLQTDLSLMRINHYELNHISKDFTIHFKEKTPINENLTIYSKLYNQELKASFSICDIAQAYLNAKHKTIADVISNEIKDPSKPQELPAELTFTINFPIPLLYFESNITTSITGFEMAVNSTMNTAPVEITNTLSYKEVNSDQGYATVFEIGFAGKEYKIIDAKR